MEKVVAELSTDEFERLVERTIDRRLEVWLTQVGDALLGLQEEDGAALRPEFGASLRKSVKQARSAELMDLRTFREKLGR